MFVNAAHRQEWQAYFSLVEDAKRTQMDSGRPGESYTDLPAVRVIRLLMCSPEQMERCTFPSDCRKLANVLFPDSNYLYHVYSDAYNRFASKNRSTSRLRPCGRRLDSSRSIDPWGVLDRVFE